MYQRSHNWERQNYIDEIKSMLNSGIACCLSALQNLSVTIYGNHNFAS